MREVLGLDLTAKDNWGSDAPNYLKEYCLSCRRADFEIPSFKNIGYWFKPNVILSLQLIKNCILEISDEPIRNFVFVAFSESIRLVSNRRNGEFKMFRMPPKKVAAFSPSVIGEFSKILSRNIEKMGNFYAACSNTSRVTIHRDNATELKSIPDDMFDLVITSPPYGDSRTTVAYGEYSRLSLQWLGLGHLTEKEILGIDRSLMGGKNTGKALLPTSTAQRCKIRWNKFPPLIWSVPEMSIAFMKTSTHPSVPCRKRQKRAAISSGSSATAP